MTYQNIQDFENRLQSFAKGLRSDMRGDTNYPSLAPKDFHVYIEKDKIFILHSNQPRWYVSVSDSDLYFQYDLPSNEDTDGWLVIQADIFRKACKRLKVGTLNSVGTKFIGVTPIPVGSKPEERLLKFLMLDPKRISVRGGTNPPKEAAFYLNYRFGIGSAALRVIPDASNEFFVIDLDCYSIDTFGLVSTDYLQFVKDALNHFSTEVQLLIAPLGIPK